MESLHLNSCILISLWLFGLAFKSVVSIEHATNLIWSQTPHQKQYTVSRLMAIQGDPSLWVGKYHPEVKHIGAPHFTWEFKSLGFHWEDQTLFWSESTMKKIQSVILNGTLDTMTLFDGTSSEVYGLAVDWYSRNLYFTDALYNWIMMLSTLPTKQGYRIVVQDDLDSPHGVAVHPKKGYLIWSDWGERPKIEIADLLGSNRRILVDRDIVKPRGLTIDYFKNNLYWVDSSKATIEMVQFNGRGRRVLHHEEDTNFYGVALYKDFIFVTEKVGNMLKVYNHNDNLITYSLGTKTWDIIMYDEWQQPDISVECELLDCEQLCVTDPLTGARCLCGEGYTPTDETSQSCKPSRKFVYPSHFYAIKESICHYPANIADMSLVNLTLGSQCFLGDSQGYTTLTYDAKENMLYYFMNVTKTIARLPLEVGAKPKLVKGGTGKIPGMALDWVSGNLYWTDSTFRHIMVSRKKGAYQSLVLNKLNNPFGIAVHPGRGKMYWTDHGHLPDVGAKVEMANLDGSDRSLVMGDNLGQPNHLYIDFVKDCLYWADSILHHVRKMDLNDGRITVVYSQQNVQFYGISLFQDFLLWTDTEDSNGIHVARMDKQEKVRGIIHPGTGVAADLITFDTKNQPDFDNPCKPEVTKCSQLCLVAAQNESRCLCGAGYQLSADGYTCYNAPVLDEFILVNDAFQKQIFQVNLKSAVIAGVVDLQDEHEPIALTYDPFNLKVFWSDNVAKLIREASIDGKHQHTVMYLNNASVCDGLAADYINRLLFFTDTGNDVIGVVSMRSYDLYTYIITDGLDEPRDIVVSPYEGHIFWSDWGFNASIQRANMDGTERETIVAMENNTVAWINGLALDLLENKLYWVDAHADSLNVIDLATRETRVLIKETDAHYFSVDVSGQFIYVTDWKKNYLRRMNKQGGQLTKFGDASFSRLYGIKAFNSSESHKRQSACAKSACEQLCLPSGYVNKFVCKCSVGYVEEMNGITCIRQTTTSAPSTTTTTTSVVVTSSPSSSSSSSSSSSLSSKSPPSSSSSSSSSSKDTTEESTWQTTMLSSEGISESHVPVTMVTLSVQTGVDNSVFTSVDYSINSQNVTRISVIPEMTTLTMKVKESQSSSFSPGIFIAIGLCVLLVVVAVVVGVLLYRKYHYHKIGHGKLVEDNTSVNFYKIAYPSRGEGVTFDTGIENPTYDVVHNQDDQGVSRNGGNPEAI